MNERQLIHTRAQVRDQVADPFAAMSILLPIPGALHDRSWLALKELDLAARIEFLPCPFDHFGFVIKGVALAGGAGHEELHHPLGTGAMMQTPIPLRARGGGV